ncbi:MAG: 50S ribosomal protein L9 [Chloroflexi bacterium]|nr:MAG: 50S ribosomal protein L9 [Chloroflexota bacterium]TMF55924.1 MAG: 50S ribosomal protein L9 [Chloroflexota bacterium]
MRVILKREVAGLGRPGDVKDVADGYAQNFLLPRGLAIEATAGELKVLARARDAKRAKQDRAHADAEELAKRLSETTLVFRLKAGEQGKTFGSVTNKDIADALQREHKVELDRTKVHLPEPLKSLGVHSVEVRLLTDVRANVTVAIEPER